MTTGVPANALATWAGAAIVALGSFLLTLPRVVSIWHISPDTIEFIGIAHNWVTGRGWVDPILYSTYLPGALPPIHGMVVRPPAISLLMSPAIALGASIPQLQLLQSFVASLIAGGAVILARRSVSLAGAVAFGIALSWSPSWRAYSSQVLSEPLAIGALLLLIAAIPAAARRPSRAALLGLLAVMAWLTRPNLALVLAAFAAALVLEGGWRTLLSRNPWIAIAVFAVGVGGIHVAVRVATGFAPFAHYGLLLQSTHALEAAAFQRSWPGFLPYVAENWERLWTVLAAGHAELLATWFVLPAQLFVGWLVLPACVYAFRREPARLASTVVALVGLGLLLVVLAFYAGNDPERLILPATMCFWLLAVEMLDALANRLSGRPASNAQPGARGPRALIVGLPLYVVLAAFGLSLVMTPFVPESVSRWEFYRAHGSQLPGGAYPPVPDSMCARIDKDAVVAAAHPWNVYLWCGNAALWLPPDLSSQLVLHRYLDAKKPQYIVSNLRDWPPMVVRGELEALLRASPRLEKVVQDAGLSLYRVRHASPPASRWDAPPPIATLGHQRLEVRR